MQPENLWEKMLTELKQKISRPSFDTWLKSTVAKKAENGVLTVAVSNDFQKDWLTTRYTEVITRIFRELSGKDWTINYMIDKHLPMHYSEDSTTESNNVIGVSDLLSKIEKLEARVKELETKVNI